MMMVMASGGVESRVRESDGGDRIDREMGRIFGVGRKSSPETFSAVVVVVAGLRELAGEVEWEREINWECGVWFQDKRNKPMTYAQQREYMRTFVKNQSSTIYTTGWTMKHVRSFSDDQLKDEFDKIRHAVANLHTQYLRRSLKRQGADLEQPDSKKSKSTEPQKTSVPAASRPSSAGVTPDVHQSPFVDTPPATPPHSPKASSHPDVTPDTSKQPSVAPTPPSGFSATPTVTRTSGPRTRNQSSAAGIKTYSTRRKSLGSRKMSSSEVDLNAADTFFIKVLCDDDSDDSDGDTNPHYWHAFAAWEIVPTGLGDVNALYFTDKSSKYFTHLREILHLLDRQDLSKLYGMVVKHYEAKPIAGAGMMLRGRSPYTPYPLLASTMKKMLKHKLEVEITVASPEQTATGKDTSNPFMAVMTCQKSYSSSTYYDSCSESGKWFQSSMDLTLSGPCFVADSTYLKVAFGVGFKMLLFNPLVFSTKDLSRNLKLTASNSSLGEDFPTGKDNSIVSTGSTKVIPAVLYNLNRRKDLSRAGPTSNNEPQSSSDAGKKDDEGVNKESGIDDRERPENSTQDVNTARPCINTASTNVNIVMSNITTTYLVPSTPNTRIHKDHSLDHVIGDVQSSVKTRRMTKTKNEQGFISAVYEGKTHKYLHTCLFACFLSQEEPKKVCTLVDLPHGKRAIGTKWVYRNKKDERVLWGDLKVMFEPDVERSKDAEMTNANQGGAEQQNVSQESGYDSSMSSDFTNKLLNLDNNPPRLDETSIQTSSLFTVLVTTIPEITSTTTVPSPPPFFNPLQQEATPTTTPTTSKATTLTPALPNFTSIFKFNERVSNLEKDLSKMKQVTNVATLVIEKNVTESLEVAILTSLFIEEESRRQRKISRPLRWIRPRDEKRKLRKEAEPSRDSRSKEKKSSSTSKDASKSQHKSFGKSTHAEEPSHTIKDLGVQQDQELDTGNNNEQPDDKEVTKADWFKKPERTLTPDPDWSKRQHVDFRPPQTWISQVAHAEEPPTSFDELNDTSFDFTTFVMNHLEEIEVRRDDQKLYTFREGDFKRLLLQDIEDMLLLLVQQNLTNLIIDERYGLNVALRMTNLKNRTTYTAYSDPKGVIYKDQMNRNILMRADELHKFSDGTLDDVWSALHDSASGIRMEYLPMKKWSNSEKKRARVMVQDIDKQLYQRRLVRNLEKFVGGREYGNEATGKDNMTLSYFVSTYFRASFIVGIKSLLEVTAVKISLLEDMDSESVHMVAASKVPMLKPGEFEI
ncbi:hypothetical protein Tco_0706639 [Tanacetum coccineum]|uniref:Reverse transcriptase Ty1/copia-type domain-containing protein n=1 Tax=Tanacetum coccineum TaxID=301880 RepID=A0ABQ4Y7Y0_9ASTR